MEFTRWGGWSEVLAADEAVDGAELVAGGAVLFLFGDLGQVGEVVLGAHGDHAVEEAGEGGVAVEDGHIVMPELPGIGFEGKAELIRVMRELAE